MFHPIRAVIDRLKARLARAAGLEPEIDAPAHQPDQKAPLLRLAEILEAEDLHAPAQELRQQADALEHKQSMAGVAASLAYWEGVGVHPALPAPPRRRIASIPGSIGGRGRTR